MVPRTIAYLTPDHKILADMFDGKAMSDVGPPSTIGGRQKKVVPISRLAAPTYADAKGKVTRIDNNLRTNGLC